MHFDFVQHCMVGLAGKPKVLKNRMVREQTQQFHRQHVIAAYSEHSSYKMGRFKMRDIIVTALFLFHSCNCTLLYSYPQCGVVLCILRRAYFIFKRNA